MTEIKPPFTVHSEGELIVIRRFGVQSVESVEAIQREVMELMKADKTKRNALVIVEVTSIPDGPSNQASVRSLNEIPFNRLAVVSAFPQRLATAKGIIEASNASERVRIFRNEEDARAWLAEDGA